MVAPLIGAGLRAGAKKLAQKFGKKDEKKTSINLIEEAQKKKKETDKIMEETRKSRQPENLLETAAKKEAEEKRRAQIESVKEGAKKTAKAAGATGAAGTTYLVGESMSPSGSGPAIDAIRRMQRESQEEEKKPVEKKAGGMIKSSASKRADGIAMKGKTRGRMV